MKIEPRTDIVEFFDLVEERREQLGQAPLMIRECVRRGVWRLEASLELVPVGLNKLHELKLIHAAGHYLGEGTDPAEAWPTHSVAITQVRDVLPVLRAGAVDFGLSIDEQLELTDRVLSSRGPVGLVATAFGRRLGAAILHCKREVA